MYKDADFLSFNSLFFSLSIISSISISFQFSLSFLSHFLPGLQNILAIDS